MVHSLRPHSQFCQLPGPPGFPLECAAAQVCREGGARVSTNVFVRDMDLAVHNALDSRRLEVVADGLTLWRGAQLAIDTTMVSPLRWDGTTRAANFDGAALEVARRRKGTTYPELSGEGGRARLVVGGGARRRRNSSLLWRKLEPRRCPWSCKAGPRQLG